MEKIRFIIFAALLAALLAVPVVVMLRPSQPDPLYQGHPLSYWMEQEFLGTNGWPAHVKAGEAVHATGSNALPVLVRLLGASDSPLKLKLIHLAQKQHFFSVHYVPAAWLNNAAGTWLSCLDSASQTAAVPDLAKVYDKASSSNSQFIIINALGRIGNDPQTAIPTVIRALDNPAAEVRTAAVSSLGEINPAPAIAVPALRKALRDPDWDVCSTACSWLRNFLPEAKTAVPDLRQLLDNTDYMKCDAAFRALWDVDPDTAADIVLNSTNRWLRDPMPARRAHTADELLWRKVQTRALVPVLIELLKDTDPSVRAAAAEALNRIDPQAAAKAGAAVPSQ